MQHVIFPELDPPFSLALEESLFDLFEAEDPVVRAMEGLLCFWEPKDYFVVVGYANRVSSEVKVEACDMAGIRVYRRLSGGGTVLQGPGCLNYALILRIDKKGPTMGISSTNNHCMERNRRVVAGLTKADVRIEGFTDMAVDGRKFSGNAQRRRRNYLIFHGCFLLNLNLEEIENCLLMPSKQPAYRESRSHREFLMNLELPADALIRGLISEWGAVGRFQELPIRRAQELVETKYNHPEWNSKL